MLAWLCPSPRCSSLRIKDFWAALPATSLLFRAGWDGQCPPGVKTSRLMRNVEKGVGDSSSVMCLLGVYQGIKPHSAMPHFVHLDHNSGHGLYGSCHHRRHYYFIDRCRGAVHTSGGNTQSSLPEEKILFPDGVAQWLSISP